MTKIADIPGYEGIYQIDSNGVIYSKNLGGSIKKTSVHPKTGYEVVHLYKNNKGKPYTVHRLVAQTFLKNVDKKKCVNHINGERDDNRLENLEYMTHSENLLHSFNIGILKRGSDHHLSKKIIATDKKGISKEFGSVGEASKVLGILRTSISNNLNGLSKYCSGYKFTFNQ